MQIKYTNGMSFITVSVKNKVRYCTKRNYHTHTYLESWYPLCKLTLATVFNIHPSKTFNILLVGVQYRLQILAQQYFYTVFKISSAVWSQTLTTTQSTSPVTLYTILLWLWSKKVLNMRKRQTAIEITLPILIILLPPTWVFFVFYAIFWQETVLCTVTFFLSSFTLEISVSEL
jgi:hypothetical protein